MQPRTRHKVPDVPRWNHTGTAVGCRRQDILVHYYNIYCVTATQLQPTNLSTRDHAASTSRSSCLHSCSHDQGQRGRRGGSKTLATMCALQSLSWGYGSRGLMHGNARHSLSSLLGGTHVLRPSLAGVCDVTVTSLSRHCDVTSSTYMPLYSH